MTEPPGPAARAEPSADAGESRVDAAIAEYLRGREAGGAFDVGRWLGRHPDVAAELADFLRDEGVFGDLVAPLLAPPDTTRSYPAAAAPAPGRGAPARGRGRTRFDDFELQGEVARGGMGVVYRARQRSLNRVVALKMVLGGRPESPGEADRLYREAEAAAGLDHPHIVPVYEVGEHGGRPFFAMKLVEGGSLSDRAPGYLGRHREAARLVATVARAVHHAHQRGVLHRDLKPSNILVDEAGEPHVTDFGLARRLDPDPGSSASGVVAGTPSYMAPEQARGEKGLTTAADVYGLGGVLYFLLTGAAPFGAESTAETLMLVLRADPVAPRAIRPDVPRDLETICLKCLEKDPGKRYASADVLADDLDRWLDGEPIHARPAGRAERAVKWVRRNPAGTALGVVSALALAAVVWGVVAFSYNAELTSAKKLADEANDGLIGANERLDTVNKDLVAALGREKQEKSTVDQLRQVAEERSGQVRRLLYAARFQSAARLWREGRLERASDVMFGSGGVPFDPLAEAGVEWAVLGIGPVRRAEIGTEWITQARPGTNAPPVRRDSTQHVAAAAFDPTGRRLVMVDRNRGLVLYDADTGREITNLETQAAAALTGYAAVAVPGFPPRDNRNLYRYYTVLAVTDRHAIAAPGETGVLSVWDLASHRLARTLTPPTPQSLTGWAVSRDGKRVAASLGDGTGVVWSIDTGEVVARLIDLPAAPVAFSPDGSLLATSGNRPQVWDLNDKRLLHTVRLAEGAPGWRGVTFTPDGRQLVITDGRSVEVWDADPPTRKSVVGAFAAERVTVCDTGRLIVATDGASTARVWTTQGRLVATYAPDFPPVFAAHARGDTVRFASGGLDRTVRATAVELDLSRARVVDTAGAVIGLWLDSGGTWAAGSSHQKAWVRNLSDGQVRHEWPGQQYSRPAVSPCGRYVASGLTVYDATTGQAVTRLQPPGKLSFPMDATFSPCGRMLAMAGSAGRGSFHVWEFPSGRLLKTFAGKGSWGITVAFSPDGKYLATGTGSLFRGGDRPAFGVVTVWDLATDTAVWESPGQLDGIYGLAWSPDGRWLATGGGTYQISGYGVLKVWDARTGALVYDLKGHTEPIWSVTFSPDGKRLVSAAGRWGVRPQSEPSPGDGEVKVWDTATGVELLTVRESDQTAFVATFSPDGRWFGIAGRDKKIRLWDLKPDRGLADTAPAGRTGAAIVGRP